MVETAPKDNRDMFVTRNTTHHDSAGEGLIFPQHGWRGEEAVLHRHAVRSTQREAEHLVQPGLQDRRGELFSCVGGGHEEQRGGRRGAGTVVFVQGARFGWPRL